MQKKIFNNQIQRNKTMFKHLHLQHVLLFLSTSIFFAQTSYAMESNFPKEEVSNNNAADSKPDETLVQCLAQLGEELNAQKLKNELKLATAPAKFSFHEKFIAARLAKIAHRACEHPKKFTVLRLVLRELLQTPLDNNNGIKETELEKTNDEPLKKHPSSFITELTAAQKPISTNKINDNSRFFCVLNSNSKTLFTANGNDITIWDVSNAANPVLITSKKISQQGNGLALSSDDKTLFVHLSCTTEIWNVSDLHNPNKISTITEISTINASPYLASLALSSDNKTLFLGLNKLQKFTVNIWNVADLKNPKILTTINYLLEDNDTPVSKLSLSSDNKTLFYNTNYHLHIYTIADLENPKIVTRLQIGDNNDGVYTYLLSSDNKKLFVKNWESFRIWNISDLNNPIPLAKIDQSQWVQNAFDYFALTSDEKRLFSSGTDYAIKQWNVSDPSNPILIETKNIHTNFSNPLVLSKDDKMLVSTSSTTKQMLRCAENFNIWDCSQIYVPTLKNYFAQLPQSTQGIIEYFFINEIITHKKNQIKSGCATSATKPLILTDSLLIEVFDQLPKELQEEMVHKKYVTFTKPIFRQIEQKLPVHQANTINEASSQNGSCTLI